MSILKVQGRGAHCQCDSWWINNDVGLITPTLQQQVELGVVHILKIMIDIDPTMIIHDEFLEYLAKCESDTQDPTESEAGNKLQAAVLTVLAFIHEQFTLPTTFRVVSRLPTNMQMFLDCLWY